MDHLEVARMAKLLETQVYLSDGVSGFSVERTGSAVRIHIPSANFAPWELSRLISALRQAERDSQKYLLTERTWLINLMHNQRIHGKAKEKTQ